MILSLVYPHDRPSDYGSDPATVGHNIEVGDAVDASEVSTSPLVVFGAVGSVVDATCLIEESDDLSSWTTMAGLSFDPFPGFGRLTQFGYGVRTKRWVRATMEFDWVDSADRWGFNVLLGDLDPEAFAGDQAAEYLGRFQQGDEISLAIQCTDAAGTPDDPSEMPTATISLDGDPPEAIDVLDLAADQRGVEDGYFRRQLHLGSRYATAGRYIVVFKWLDSDSVARVATASFHLLPGGDGDGAVIAMHSSQKPDASYLLMQCDSGKLIRKANPR